MSSYSSLSLSPPPSSRFLFLLSSFLSIIQIYMNNRFGVCLVNTPTLTSYPASRLLNFDKLYEEMTSLLPDMEDKIGNNIPLYPLFPLLLSSFSITFLIHFFSLFFCRIFHCSEAKEGQYTSHFPLLS